jgi:hypothetical protein
MAKGGKDDKKEMAQSFLRIDFVRRSRGELVAEISRRRQTYDFEGQHSDAGQHALCPNPLVVAR